MGNSEFVIEKICRQVRDAYDSKKPLIMLDTDEIELATRVAGSCGVVDFIYNPDLQNYPTDAYYDKYIRAEEKDLDACENFSIYPKALFKLIELGSAGKNEIDAKLVLLHITPSESGYQADKEIVTILRAYVKSYIGFDDYSPIRSSCVILYGDRALLPKDLQGYTENIVPDYPSVEEIKETINKINNRYGDKKYPPVPEDMRKLAVELRGFTLIQTEHFVKDMLYLKQENGAPLLCSLKECRKQVLQAKIQNLMRFGGLLTLCTEKQNDSENGNKNKASDTIGGMTTYIKKAEEIKKLIDEAYCMKRGISPINGVMLVGVSGCGKSEASRLLHRTLGIPMLKLDMGTLMQGLVGASERNLRMALAQAEAMSPVVLYIDEIDKGISGAESSSSDGGAFRRMVGYLLNWLQEKSSPCFVIATANDISHLPRELFRNERFDIRFGVFMPTHDEIKNIFAVHMKRAEEKRTDEAKRRGEELPCKLFADNCFAGDRNSETPAVPDSVIRIFTHTADTDTAADGSEEVKLRNSDEIKFVTGADIKTIVKNALGRFDDAELDKPLDCVKWTEKLREVIEDNTTQTMGDSEADLNAIAACYIRLLRKGFVPVNDYVLFRSKDYTAEYDKEGKLIFAGIRIDRTESIDKDKPYDKELYKVLFDKINQMALSVEQVELEKECR